jgi:hypothetical protein
MRPLDQDPATPGDSLSDDGNHRLGRDRHLAMMTLDGSDSDRDGEAHRGLEDAGVTS